MLSLRYAAEACLEVAVGDVQPLGVCHTDPAEKSRGDFDVKSVAVRDGRDDAGCGDITWKAAKQIL